MKALKWFLVIIVILIVLIGIVKFLANLENNWYTTNNIADYGRITRNGNNEYVKDFVGSFFPDQIEPYFENVIYEYRVRQWCDYCCEVYLEFSIEDREQFRNYVQETTEGLTGSEFVYDDQYTDYVISSSLPIVVWNSSSNDEESVQRMEIELGHMGRILVCEDAQRIIFTSIMVTGCCGEEPDSFGFYERFGIDPLTYAQTNNEVRYSNLD